MRRTVRRWAVVGLLAALAVTAGCSGDDGAGDDARTVSDPQRAEQDLDSGDSGGGQPASGGEADDGAGQEAAADAPARDEAGRDDATIAVGGETAGRQVIRRAHVALASDDPEQTVEDVGTAAEDAGGFVAGTDLHREDGVLAGTITLRVPADELSDTLSRIEAAGVEVRSRQLSSEDVTGEITDIESQLRNLRALETELLELLSEARETGDTEQVLAVFDRVRETRGEIERLEGRRANLDDLVSLATIEVRVEPTDALLLQTAPERDPEPGPWSPAQQVDRAWNATLGALQGLADAVIVLAVTVLPIVLVLALPVVAVLLVVRRWWRHRTDVRQPAPAPSVPSSGPDRD